MSAWFLDSELSTCLNGAGGADHYYSVEIMPDFSDRLNR